jgi:hypothetical protein
VKKLQNHTRAAAADEATRLRQSEEKVKYISEQLANGEEEPSHCEPNHMY